MSKDVRIFKHKHVVMKKVRNLALALLLALFVAPAFAQPFGLRITMNGNQALPDTLTLGSQYNFQVFLHNDSSFTFNDTVLLFYRIDTVNYISPNESSGLEYPLIAADSVLANDSVAINITAHVTSPAFKAGPSVVVIWPIAKNHNLTFDTLIRHPFIRDLGNGVQQPDVSDLQMQVAGGTLRFLHDSNLPLMYVRIYNSSGQMVLQKNAPADEMQLPSLPAGVYFTEIGYDNRRHLFRFTMP